MNSKHTKRALFSSFWALLLCFAMLLGTTFAWFTDTASTSVNKIQAGNLKVELGNYNDDKEWVDYEGKTLTFLVDGEIPEEGTQILWEPGCTYYLEEVAIRNTGNLALKFKVDVTGIKGDAKLNEAIEWDVFVGTHEATPYEAVSGDLLNTEYTLLPGEFLPLTIGGHMKEEAGNEYQGLSIDGVGITVYATQWTYESDSFGNDYDAGATLPSIAASDIQAEQPTKSEDGIYHIDSVAKFYGLMTGSNVPAGSNVVLDCDIDLGGATITGYNQGGPWDNFFDGQGHTVSNFTLDRSADNNPYYTGLFGYLTGAAEAGASIKNLTVKNATVIGQKQVGVIVGNLSDENNRSVVDNCRVENCTIIGAKKVGAVVGLLDGGTVTNCSATNCTVIYSDEDAGEIIGFDNTSAGANNTTENNTYSNVTISAGVSTADDLSAALESGKNVTLMSAVKDDTPPHRGGDSPYHPYQVEDQYTIKKGQELTIDLNGEVYDASVRLFHVLDGGKLTIKSSKPGGKITIKTTDPDFNYAKNAYGMQVEKGGTLNIEENVTIEMNVTGVTNPVALCWNNGTVNINGGELIVYDSVAFTNGYSNFGTSNMNGGKITLESKQTNGTSIGFAITGSSVDVNLNAGSITGKGLAYKVLYGTPEIEIAEGFVINTTQGPNT